MCPAKYSERHSEAPTVLVHLECYSPLYVQPASSSGTPHLLQAIASHEHAAGMALASVRAVRQLCGLHCTSSNVRVPCPDCLPAASCARVPRGYTFYPAQDTDAESGGCFNYAQQAGFTMSSALDMALLALFPAQCSSNPGCTGFTFLPAPPGGIVSTARP